MYFSNLRLAVTLQILYFSSFVWSHALTKSHRGAPTTSNLEYAESPTDFLKSNPHPDLNENNYNYIPKPPSHYSSGSGRSTNSFDGALPYDKYASQERSPGTNKLSQPTATLYNNFQNNQEYDNHRKLSSNSDLYNGLVSTNAVKHPNKVTAQSYQSDQPTSNQHFSSAKNYFPANTNVQQKLDFDLFSPRGYNQAAPNFNKETQNYNTAGNRYYRSTPFTSNIKSDAFKPNQQSSYPLSPNPYNNVGTGYNEYNTGYNYNGFRPILAQGFSVPTTYEGNQKTDLLSNEAFSSVTDPKSDKRVAIGTYVPENNFVNPSNFLIPTEDKYNMISRIFGGFQVPTKNRPQQQQQQQQAKQNQYSGLQSSHSTSHNTKPYSSQNELRGNNRFNQNENIDLAQNSFRDKQNNHVNPQYTNYQKGGYNDDSGVRTANTKNNNVYFSGPSSVSKPGYAQGFENQGQFSYSPSQSSSNDYNKGSIFGARDDPPTLLFSDFTYNNPLSLNQFRSKNLLGDENFGKTEYDNNRLTPDSLFEKNNQNYYQNGNFFASNPNSQVSERSSGTNGYKQEGGTNVVAGNSYDKSYTNNRGYDTSYDDNANKNGQVLGYSPQNVGYSDQARKSNEYNNGAEYSDGDGYSKSFTYSDGGGDSSYRSTEDGSENGYEKSYENAENNNDMDSYNDAQGYNRLHYDGKNYDVTDGYTDNVNYDTRQQQDSNQQHYNTDTNDDDGVNNYRQGVEKVASALAASGTPTVEPYQGLSKSVTDDLPKEADYKPFDVNGPVV